MSLDKLKKLVNSLESGKIDDQQIAELNRLAEGLSGINIKKPKEAITKEAASALQPQNENFFITESNLKAIIDSSFGVFFLLDINKRILLFNKLASEKFEHLYHCKIKAGDDIRKYSPAGKLEEFNRFFNRCLCGEMVQTEELLVFPSGQQVWTENIMNQVFNQEGKMLGVAYRSLDITSRKNAEKKLRESEEKYRIIIENMDDVIFSAAVDGTIKFISLNCYNLLGYYPEEIVEKNLFEFVYTEDMEFVIQEFQKILITKTTTPIVSRIVSKSGKLIYVEERGKIIFDEQGNIQLFTGIIRDVSDRLIAENQIKSALQEKEVLLREIHHRVKNNMQVIISLINMHLLDFSDVSVLKKFKELQERVRTMSLVHEDLYMSENLAQIEFSNYIRKLMSNLFASYGANEKVSSRINISNILLDIDTAIPSGLIVNELVSNSLKYAFPDDKISSHNGNPACEILVEFLSEDDHWVLTVRDNGIGMSSGFDLQTSKSMGLRLVNILVTDQLNGSMNLYQNKDSGLEVKILFKKRNVKN